MAELSDDKNKDLCAGCSLCCESVTIELDPPEDYEDLDNMVWYVLHKDVLVYVDDEGDWYVSFKTKCDALQADKLCGLYEERPNVCRTYTQEGCEKYGDGPFSKHLFTTRQSLLAYYETKPKLKKVWDKGWRKMMEKTAKANAKKTLIQIT